MIKNVAKAIGDTVYGYVDENDTPNTWATSMEMARAAMEAMLEPTESMNFAGSIIGDYPWDGKKPSRVFSAMILAALEVK